MSLFYEEDIKVLKREIYLREVAITELKGKLELAEKTKDEIQLTKNFYATKPDLSFPGLEAVYSEDEAVSKPKIEKKTVKPSLAKIEFVKPKGKTARKTTKQVKLEWDSILQRYQFCYHCGLLDPLFLKGSTSSDDGSKPSSDDDEEVDEDLRKIYIETSDDPNILPALEDYSIFDLSSDDQDNGAEADMNNLDTIIQVSPIPTTRIHKDHPVEQIIGDLNSAPQTRRMTKNLEEHDDIIFGSTKKSLCTEFEKMMHKKFQMSSMGELTFFLGLTPMETQKLLLKDEDGEEVDSYTDSDYAGASLDRKYTKAVLSNPWK
ncbi:hypothetical protein Tco_0920125 [Tanacetum coccineum]